MLRSTAWIWTATIVVATGACVSDVSVGELHTGPDGAPPDAVLVDDGDPASTVTDAAVATARPVDLDVLFVIDNSGSMYEEQASLASNFARYLAELDKLPGGRPNLHIGVVSTSMGTGPYAIDACDSVGDDGRLQNAPRGACASQSGFWIEDVADDNGGRRTNYRDQGLDGTFACIALLGTSGCGFEQPLEAMKAALDGRNPENAGFLRDDAHLAVVIVTDEDDCSAADPSVFDPAQTMLTEPLGEFTSFRCTEFGVVCDGTTIARAPATYQSCTARDGMLLGAPKAYADFLLSLKADPLKVSVAAIAGTPSPFAVGHDEKGNLALLPSCESTAGKATPAVRIRDFLDGFQGRSTFLSICRDNLAEAVTFLGTETRRAILDADKPPGVLDQQANSTGCACQVGRRSHAGWPAAMIFIALPLSRRRCAFGLHSARWPFAPPAEKTGRPT